MNSKFVNPYETYTGEFARINSNVPRDKYEYLRRMRVVRGTVQTTINILFEKLIQALANEHIDSYSDEAEFISFVTNCRIVRGTPGGPASQTNERNDRRGTESVRIGDAHVADVSPDLASKARAASARRGKTATSAA